MYVIAEALTYPELRILSNGMIITGGESNMSVPSEVSEQLQLFSFFSFFLQPAPWEGECIIKQRDRSVRGYIRG